MSKLFSKVEKALLGKDLVLLKFGRHYGIAPKPTTEGDIEDIKVSKSKRIITPQRIKEIAITKNGFWVKFTAIQGGKDIEISMPTSKPKEWHEFMTFKEDIAD